MATLINCLICNSDLNSTSVKFSGEGDDGDGEESKKQLQFQMGFQLFCKLLKIEGKNIDDLLLVVGGRGNGKDSVAVRPPCCKKCCNAFEQLIRVQHEIEELQATLMENLEKLKVALQSSISSDYEEDPLKIPADDMFGRIRDQLLSCVRKSNPQSPSNPDYQTRKKRKQPSSEFTTQEAVPVISKKAKEYLPCSVILKRLSPNLVNGYPKCDENYSEEITVPSPEAASPSPNNQDDDDDDYPWESEAELIPETSSDQLNSTCGTRRESKFSLISPDTLLYNYTLIKVSQGYTQFTCQAPDCPSPDYSDPSLNWNDLFHQLADHIKDTHSSEAPYKNDLPRTCPLCPVILGSGPKFRGHLIGTGRKNKSHHHRIETIVCEICWKPIRNVSDMYRCHLWKHKNAKEKEESPEELPPTFRSYLNKRKDKTSRKYGKLNQTIRKKKPEIISKPKKQVKSKNKLVPKPKLKNDDENRNQDEDKYSLEPEVEPVPQNLPNQLNSNCVTSRLSKFSLISPGILLYQYTLIKVSQGYTKFTCQEPECPSPNFLDNPLNWKNLFNRIADHIKTVHGTTAPEKFQRKCPLCPMALPSGPKFRAHLIGTGRKSKSHHHRIDTIVCEICWKPIRNVSDMYRCHLWKHKNSKEKEETPDELPPTFRSYLNKRKDKTSRKYGKLPKIPKKNTKIEPVSKRQVKLKGEDVTIRIDNHFSKIQENSQGYLLLYKCTLLKALYGISLTCQEFNCDFIINGTDFTAFEQFKDHVNTCHSTASRKSDAVYKCPLCSSEDLKTCFNFRRHLLFNCPEALSTSNTIWLICTTCWKPMKTIQALDYHQWHHKSDIEKEYEPPPYLVRIKEKERQSELKCRYCQKTFNFVLNLNAHEATHLPKEERKRFMCHQCPRLFLSPAAVRGHVEREHERELMRWRTCPFCSKQFNWRNGYAFRSHLKRHTNLNERPFVCEVCGMAFFDGYQLGRHKRKVHEEKGDRPWQCEFCEMNYKEKNHLIRHRRNAHKDMVGEEEGEERVEDKEKRLKFTLPEYRPDFIGPRIAFPCPGCEKVFQLRSRMKKHWEKSCNDNKL